jgi:hypothetical protein
MNSRLRKLSMLAPDCFSYRCLTLRNLKYIHIFLSEVQEELRADPHPLPSCPWRQKIPILYLDYALVLRKEELGH